MNILKLSKPITVSLLYVGALILLSCNKKEGSYLKYDFQQKYFANSFEDTLRYNGVGYISLLKDSSSLILPEDSSFAYEFNRDYVRMKFGVNGILIDTSRRMDDTYRGTILTHADISREYYILDSMFWEAAGYTRKEYQSLLKGRKVKVEEFIYVDTVSLDTLKRIYYFDPKTNYLLRKRDYQQYLDYQSFEELNFFNFEKVSELTFNKALEKSRSNAVNDSLTYRVWEKSKVVYNPFKGMELNKIPTLSSGEVFLSNEKSKFILIDFWYLSCAPCLNALPELKKLNDKYVNTDFLKVIGVNPFDNKANQKVKEYLKLKGFSWTNYYVDTSFPKKIGINGYPTTLLLNDSLKVVSSFVGFNDQMYSQIDSIITNGIIEH